jgi:hypothetical protein
MTGQVAEAARKAKQVPTHLHYWYAFRPDFRRACAKAARRQAIVALAC